MSRAHCLWCQQAFQPRLTGGKPQRFCSETCRRDLDTAARNWVAKQLTDGVLTVTYLRECLSDNARVALDAQVSNPGTHTSPKYQGRNHEP